MNNHLKDKISGIIFGEAIGREIIAESENRGIKMKLKLTQEIMR